MRLAVLMTNTDESAFAQVHPKDANSFGIQFMRQADHVGAAMTARKTMQQNHDPVPRLPVAGTVIVQNQQVVIRQAATVLLCLIG